MMTGTAPVRGYYGECMYDASWSILQDPQLFCFAAVKSDLAERLSQHGHARNHLANFVCDLDMACKHFRPLHYGDCRRQAGWRNTLVMHEDYLMGSTKSIWNGMPGFSIWRHVFDLMHI